MTLAERQGSLSPLSERCCFVTDVEKTKILPSLYLADSNILLRFTKRDHPQYPLMRGAVHLSHTLSKTSAIEVIPGL